MIVFVVPVHDRKELATATLRQLRRTCEQIGDATAVMVGDDPFFERLAAVLGFRWVWSENEPLGKKWNDGIWYAATQLNADYFVRFGSDDLIHPDFFADLPPAGVIACTRNSAMVSPDGNRLVNLNIKYDGGDGVQIVPRDIYQRLNFRPCLEDKHRAIDGSIITHLRLTTDGDGPRFDYRDTPAEWILDFKTDTPDQRNTFQACLVFAESERRDVWETVGRVHGELAAAEVARVYGKTLVAHGERLVAT